MPDTCPYCLQTDLPAGAQKCRACGSWLDPAREGDPHDAIRRAVRMELRDDLKDHRSYLEGLLSQLKYVAALVVAAALAASVFFGIRTDQSISATASRIAAEAEAQIKTATADVTEVTRARVAEAVRQKLDAPETARLIEEVLAVTLAESVKVEVAERFAAVSAEVAAEVEASQAQLGAVVAEIEDLRQRSQAALASLQPIEASFGQAREQTVATSQSVLPVDPVRVEGKGDMSSLEALLREPVEALSFQLGNYYYGPVVWAYVDRLRTLPEFRHVVVTDGLSGALVGFYDAARLAAALDPIDAADLRGPLAQGSIPGEERVARWSEFAGWVQNGDVGALAALPSYVDPADAVRNDWPSVRALDHLERMGRDRLPVVDAAGLFVGVIDRSRLTTRVLLEIAGGGQ